MNRSLRNELLFLCGLAGVLAWRSKSVAGATAAAGVATALVWAERREEGLGGQSVVITGGSRGLGYALAREALAQHARVAILARDVDELERAKGRLEREFPLGRILALRCDVTVPIDVTTALHHIHHEFGGVDMVVNNAGAITVGPYADMTREDFTAQLDLHFYAAMDVINQALPYLRMGKGKRIVNISSMGGRVGVPHMIPYDVSKFALAGYSQGLSAELAGEGISVTTVFPALMRTGSPIQAVFKGDHEKEFAWFAAGDVLPGLSAAPESIARKILWAARHRQSELMPSLPAKARMVAAAFFPEIVASIMKLMAGALPEGHSSQYKTGAQSRALFDRIKWFAPLRAIQRSAERTHNQESKSDARFNMGLDT